MVLNSMRVPSILRNWSNNKPINKDVIYAAVPPIHKNNKIIPKNGKAPAILKHHNRDLSELFLM